MNKSKLNKYAKLNKMDKDDAIFIKQVPVHSKNRFKKISNLNDKVEFIKQVPVHPRDNLHFSQFQFIREIDWRGKLKKKAMRFIFHQQNRLSPNKLKHPKNKLAANKAQCQQIDERGI